MLEFGIPVERIIPNLVLEPDIDHLIYGSYMIS